MIIRQIGFVEYLKKVALKVFYVEAFSFQGNTNAVLNNLETKKKTLQIHIQRKPNKDINNLHIKLEPKWM